MAESLLALKLTDPDESVRKIGLQVFSRISDYKDYKKSNAPSQNINEEIVEMRGL